MSVHGHKVGGLIDIIFDSETSRDRKKIAEIKDSNPDKIVVFFTGCFDVAHSGQPIFTEQARLEGEKALAERKSEKIKNGVIVVAGIGRDSTLTSLKSKGRPVNPLMNRAYMLASYKNVDYVILNDKKIGEGKVDFKKVLKALKPDVFVLNSDDSGLEVKKKICERLGILFRTVERTTPDFLVPTSSTAIMAKIRSLKN